MAEKVTDLEKARKTRAAKLQNLRNLEIKRVKKQDAAVDGGAPPPNELYRRAIVEEEDPFSGQYQKLRLKTPPYPFINLYQIFEESDILQSCVDAMQKNVDGFGYQMQFLGDDLTEKDTPEMQAIATRAQNFFDQVNEEQSFTTIRQLMRMDLEVLGNGAFEVIRNLEGKVQVMYYMPFKYLRLAEIGGDPVQKEVVLVRDGKPQKVTIRRFYRRFAQLLPVGSQASVRWFKEFGDPRVIDATTGEIMAAGVKPKIPASEIWHFKLPFGGMAYGLPRWIGCVLSVMGRRAAEYVNYDLFENQGIPPMAILVSGGTLSDESIDELEKMIKGMRGVENWNKIAIIEAIVESQGLEDRGTAKLELKSLADARKDDLMFGKYMESTEKTTRHRYRMPPLYVGAAETFTHATAKAAQTVAEEQVFIPERQLFDEQVNRKLLPEIEVDNTKWLFKSRGPRVVGADNISSALDIFNKAGGFTVNHAIERANEAFGLEMSKFKQPWANYPVPLLVELIKSGQLLATDIIEGLPPRPEPPALPSGGKQKLLPAPSNSKAVQKALESEMFSDEEKALYKLLLNIQSAVDRSHIVEADLQ